jgi:hypothetical protein
MIVIDTREGPRGIREKNLQKLDSIQLEGGLKGPRAFRRAKARVSIWKYARVAKKFLLVTRSLSANCY